MPSHSSRLLAAALELDLDRLVRELSPADSEAVAQNFARAFQLQGPRPKHAALYRDDDSDRKELSADPYERLLSSFLADGVAVYYVSHSAAFGGSSDSVVLSLAEPRYASLLSWWAGVENYYWCAEDFSYALSANLYTVQARGGTGIPDDLWDKPRGVT